MTKPAKKPAAKPAVKKPAAKPAVKKPAAKKPPAAAPPVDAEGFLCLTGDKLWKWRALDAELRAGQAELDRLTQTIQVEIARNPELSSLIQQKAALVGTISVAKAELLTVQSEIEQEMGVSLQECAFDDKTGRLYHLATDGSRGDPVKSRTRSSRPTRTTKEK